MADRIRVGVVGAHAERGWGRHIHLPALGALNDFQVTAVAATTAASARAAAEVWGAEKSYDDARALMADPDVDLVTVAVQLPSRDGLVEAAIAERFGSAARARAYGTRWDCRAGTTPKCGCCGRCWRRG
ncbi:Gfo/Idh/MocA family oxidoreductase [Streptomyces canus]|uniref:Gfo/Idh/MocA family oxidoreductase n=1 Tax=Streptomyces canus TaxID=58343 RepID=UPI00367794BF